MGNLADLYRASDAVDLAVRVRGGHMSASELAATVIKWVESLNPGLNAVICKPCDIGRRMPPQADRIAPLAGVPYVLKECGTGWQGVPATGVSRFPQDPVATDDRHIATRIKASGLCPIDKTSALENGWSIATELAHNGATLNLGHKSLTPGGTSGGSAMAIAVGRVPIAEFSYAAGLFRMPASVYRAVQISTESPATSLRCGWCLPDLTHVKSGKHQPQPRKPDRRAPTCKTPECAASVACCPATFCIRAGRSPPGGPLIRPASNCRRAGGLGSRSAKRFHQTRNHSGHMETVVGRTIGPDDANPLSHALIGRLVVQHRLPFDVFPTPALTLLPRPKSYDDMSMTDPDAHIARWADAVFMVPFNLLGQPAVSLPVGKSRNVPVGMRRAGCCGSVDALLAVAAVLQQVMPWKGRHPPDSM